MLRPTAVLAPLAEEIAPLRRRLRRAERLRLPSLPWAASGELSGAPVVLAVTGDGETRARRGAAALLAALRPARLVAVGVAGGLSPELAAGVVVAAREVVGENGGRHFADDGLAARAAAAGARPGLAVTTCDIAATRQAKTELLRRLGAGAGKPPEAAVVDLESAFYAEAAEGAGVPWLVLRAVSDTAAEGLPAFLATCRDEGGAVARGAVVRHALLHPGVIPDLLRLARRVRRCAGALAACVEEMLGAAGIVTL